jgi:hypothetical protein
MTETGYGPQFYKDYGYNKSRDVVPQRRREWEGVVFPHLELKKPYNHKNFPDMMHTYDAFTEVPDYPKSRGEAIIPVTWTPPVMIPVDLIATPSSSGGISETWSDNFTGTDTESVNPAKWTLGFGLGAQISSNQAYLYSAITTMPGIGNISLCYIISKAPTWENFSATIYAPAGTGNNGGIALGWWPNTVMWGLVYGWGGAGMLLFSPTGFSSGPAVGNNVPFYLKLEKTASAATGYYSFDGLSWTSISTIASPPSDALSVAGAGSTGRNLFIVDTFTIDFSGGATVSVDLQWTSDAPTFELKRNGATIYSGTLKAYTDTAVASATTYLYEITAYDVKGNRIGYDQVYATTP